MLSSLNMAISPMTPFICAKKNFIPSYSSSFYSSHPILHPFIHPILHPLIHPILHPFIHRYFLLLSHQLWKYKHIILSDNYCFLK